MGEMVLARKIHFSCGHKYSNPQWSDEKNREVFGSCYSEHGHGHNYYLELYLQGEVNSSTGMIINLRDVDEVLKKVTDQLDHKFLNEEVPYFKEHVPTTENIALFCLKKIKHELQDKKGVKVKKVKLNETEDLWVEVCGEE